ncbi:MAG: PepSY domain-containing protein [Acidobacteriota bacterium]|nr:PepSY domain-containing protein [Acidobacteriota bacterium]MDH3530069.1 PepSY domain-containing protein [Acidobacteriota bacterium]
MKKNALVVSGLVTLLALAGIGFGMSLTPSGAAFADNGEKVTAEQAKAIAVKRVPGTVQDEYTFEDDEGEIETYVFIIKNKDDKVFEVQIAAEDGEVISVEEYVDDDDDSSEDPPSAN